MLLTLDNVVYPLNANASKKLKPRRNPANKMMLVMRDWCPYACLCPKKLMLAHFPSISNGMPILERSLSTHFQRMADLKISHPSLDCDLHIRCSLIGQQGHSRREPQLLHVRVPLWRCSAVYHQYIQTETSLFDDIIMNSLGSHFILSHFRDCTKLIVEEGG